MGQPVIIPGSSFSGIAHVSRNPHRHRKSAPALWQAEHVKARFEQAHPGLKVSLVPMVSRGDKLLDAAGENRRQGLFVKELETALLENQADIAVHSMKDVPMDFPEGLGLYCICEREDPRDAFVSNTYASLDALPAGSGRHLQPASPGPAAGRAGRSENPVPAWQRQHPPGKLDAGDYDAIILAAAG